MKSRFKKLLTSQIFLFLFIFQNIIPASNNIDSIDKFIFLENKLSKNQEGIITTKAKEYSIKGVIAVITSFVFSKLLEYFFWKKIESFWARKAITWVTPNASDYDSAYTKINRLIFLAMIPACLVALSKMYKKKDLKDSDILVLEAFIKNWPVNKINTPGVFHDTFDSLHNIFLKNKKLGMSEFLAKEIIRSIALETKNFITNKQKTYNEIEKLEQKLPEIDLTDEAKEEIEKGLIQLKRAPPYATETTVLQNHLEWLVGLPWGICTQDTIDIQKAKEILDQEHYGLEEVKERILDFLAVKALKNKCKTPILCLAGPPGVGKTSIGKSIAKCVGKKFFRLSLGGVHDESEIRGHRKTYVGAMPGRFIQAIKKTGTCNPLIMLDEIDKVGASAKGDPFAALLEILDPEQNATFYDNYLGVHFDLSQVMFIATANYIDKIPKPLKDRMELIELSGYSVEEKMEITKRHIIPKAIKDSGLENKGFALDDKTLAYIIKNYSIEPGMREIERYIYKLCSKFARYLLEKNEVLKFCIENISEYFGPKKSTFI